ncbi:MAG TPA: hypothetical protein VEC02_03675 [Nitrososphaerales archaeon]|nr:hypothetical protein [Nitrososphaerales archaeon]
MKAATVDRFQTSAVSASACFLILLTLGPPAAYSSTASSSGQPTGGWGQYAPNSWALGVVVPDGAQFTDGGRASWPDVNNVTARVRLPSINGTDGAVYAVLSVMTNDDSVLQVAAGIYPDSGRWLVYSDLVTSVLSIPPAYSFVLNASGPSMLPGANVSLAVFRSEATWNLKVTDMDTGSSVEQAFPASVTGPLKPGDQEVFALESFSSTETVFENMGNLTLESVFLNGRRIVAGCYSYDGWDAGRNPLFAVGGYGPSPPSFVSMTAGKNGVYTWQYSRGWVSVGGLVPPSVVGMELVVLLLVSLGAVYLVFVVLTKRHSLAKPPKGQRSSRSG